MSWGIAGLLAVIVFLSASNISLRKQLENEEKQAKPRHSESKRAA